MNQIFKPTIGISLGAAIAVGAIYGFSDNSQSSQNLPRKILIAGDSDNAGKEKTNLASREPSRISAIQDHDEIQLWSDDPERTGRSVTPGTGPTAEPGKTHLDREGDAPPNTISDDEFDLLLSNPITFNQSLTSQSTGPLKTNIRPRESTTLQAVQHIEYGKALARRGAHSSAKQEFTNALSVLAQDYDSQSGIRAYSHSLRAGMLALKEAEDFSIQESDGQIGFDPSSLIEAHHCGVLKPYDAKGMTLSQIREAYFNFAEGQILNAVGKNVISAEALYCLGRLYSLRAESDHSKIGLAQSATFHRLALHCNPADHRCANELGVLLAEFGELNSSVELLKQSLRNQPNPQTWENLAKLHQRLNQPGLAEQASREHQRALSTLNTGMIQWLDPPSFNSSAPPDAAMVASVPTEMEAGQTRAANATKPAQTQSTQGTKDNSSRSMGDRIKSWF